MTAYLLIDTETNGLFDFSKPADADGQPRLAELAMILIDPLDPDGAMEQHFLIKPEGWIIGPEMQAINGLTQAMLDEKGVPVLDAINAYAAAIDHGAVVVAHNAQFDTKVMRGEMRRAGVDDRFEQTPNICTMRSLTMVCNIPKKNGKGVKNPKFKEAYAHFFGKEPEGQHTAEGDVRALREIFMEMFKRDLLPEPKIFYATNRPDAIEATTPEVVAS
jgi:DNA polymerase-3 subunit epsilon